MSTNVDQAGISERELFLTRIFDAPPEKVFRAWTEPELIKQWFAGRSSETYVSCKIIVH